MSELKDEDDSVDTLTNAARTWRQADKVDSIFHFVSHRSIVIGKEPSKSLLSSSKALRRLSVILHSTLVVLHLVLIAIWATNLEHRLVFPFDIAKNKLISFFITTISTTFGTVRASG
jgi:hypothetical protein